VVEKAIHDPSRLIDWFDVVEDVKPLPRARWELLGDGVKLPRVGAVEIREVATGLGLLRWRCLAATHGRGAWPAPGDGCRDYSDKNAGENDAGGSRPKTTCDDHG
jgi:hypothetical protein